MGWATWQMLHPESSSASTAAEPWLCVLGNPARVAADTMSSTDRATSHMHIREDAKAMLENAGSM